MLKVLQYGAVFLLLLLVILAMARVQHALYRFYRRITIGDQTLWEFMAADTERRQLLVPSDRQLLVVDMDKDEITARVAFNAPVYGVAVAPRLNSGFICHRAGNAISVFNLQTLEITRYLENAGRNPESLFYDVFSKRLFVYNGRSSSLTVIDPAGDIPAAEIILPGKPITVAGDEKGSLFILQENREEITQLDAMTHVVRKRWVPAPGEIPGGIAIDSKHDLLFSAYSGRMMVSGIINGEVLATVAIGDTPGPLFYDTAAGLIYSTNADGPLFIIRQDGAGDYDTVQRLAVQSVPRSLVMDHVTGKLYVMGLRRLPGGRNLQKSLDIFRRVY